MSSKYLIVKGCAGLGNRLVTVYAALQYCLATQRKLVIDWTDGQFDIKGENPFFKCFIIKNDIITSLNDIKNLASLTSNSKLLKQNISEGVYDLLKVHETHFLNKIPQRLFYNQSLKKIRRRWQPLKHGNYFNAIAFGSDLNLKNNKDIVFYVDFIPYINYHNMPNYIDLVPSIKYKIEHFSDLNNLADCIGVHVRYTDKKPTSTLQKLVTHLKTYYQKIFLCTDSVAVEQLFLKEFDKNVILFPKHKPELKQEGLHQWALYNNNDECKFEMFEQSVIEMFLLSKCQYLYYQGNSTFSQISKTYHLSKTNCYDWLKL